MKLTLEKAKQMLEQNNNSLDLSGTPITELPDNLTVGGWLDLSGTQIVNKEAQKWRVKKLKDGDYVEGRYLYADSILTHIRKRKNCGAYTLYIGKIPGRNVVSDGTYYAHCDKLRDGISDLLFKAAKDRGAEQYKGLDLDAPRTVEEMKTMYRVITGACRQGTENFVNGLGGLKERYTIREVMQLTEGQYGSDSFARFFTMEDAE